jgi:hypothetical protein
VLCAQCPKWKKRGNRSKTIPPRYLTQVMQQMAVTGIMEAHYVEYWLPTVHEKGVINILSTCFDKGWWHRALERIDRFWATRNVYLEMSLKQRQQLLAPAPANAANEADGNTARKRKKRKPATAGANAEAPKYKILPRGSDLTTFFNG